jgi:hypothetical protein
MATNQYFNQYSTATEQNLLESLVIESIKIYGIDMYFLPRTTINRDEVFREGATYQYNSAYALETYVKNVDGFAGDGEFLSKFGLEVRDQVVFTVSQSRWANVVATNTAQLRPSEGDCIYFPFTTSLFQIKYVDLVSVFFQLGKLQTYELTCELFEYNQEKFSTGITAIDNVYNGLSLVEENYQLLSSSNNVISTEDGGFLVLESYIVDVLDNQAQNEIFDQEALDFLDFTERDPFSEGTRF